MVVVEDAHVLGDEIYTEPYLLGFPHIRYGCFYILMNFYSVVH